jgi:hypothetical protein
MIGICVRLGLDFRIIEKPNLYKVIAGSEKGTVETIRALEDTVFRHSIVPMESVRTYGLALGYPECCVSSFIEWENNDAVQNKVGARFAAEHVWPADHNFFSNVIDHLPCSNDCKLTGRLGQGAIRIRGAMVNRVEHEVIRDSQGWVLHFGQNLWSYFQAEAFSRDRTKISLRVSRVLSRSIDPHLEAGDIHLDFDEQVRFVASLERDACVTISDSEAVLVTQGSERIAHRKIDRSDGCLIRFA